MKKLLLANAVLAALVATPTMAADMPVKYKAPPPVFSWTGCYGGIDAGLLIGRDRYVQSMAGAFLAPGNLFANPANGGQLATAYGSPNDSAFNGGVEVGCNYQAGWVVFGVAADFSGTSLRETQLASYGPTGPFVGGLGLLASSRTETVTKDLSWFSTFRGRIGIAGDRVLVYATGGLAVARIKSTTNETFAADQFFLSGDIFQGSATVTRTGWTAGAGIEWPVAPGWTTKLEYLYLDFGSFTYTSPCVTVAACGGPGFAWQTNVRVRESVFRVGINYLFGGPVVAKY
jgi:outer membrane immunogenic protein